MGPRFPVLALFTNRNVFHPPSSPLPHLVADTAANRYPLTPFLQTFLVVVAALYAQTGF